MSQTVVFPRLYRIQLPGPDDTIFSRGDETISELFRIYETGAQDTANLTFRLRVLDSAVRLFGDFHEWMTLQRNNPNLLGYNLEFLRDTLRYILTGHRDMSPLIWLDLVAEKSIHTTQAHHLTLSELAPPKDLDTTKLIQLWCSRKGGFEDLLQSLFLLFGKALQQEQQG